MAVTEENSCFVLPPGDQGTNQFRGSMAIGGLYLGSCLGSALDCVNPSSGLTQGCSPSAEVVHIRGPISTGVNVLIICLDLMSS